MITKVMLIKYYRDDDKVESQIESWDVTSDLVENDYSLNYQLEFGSEFEFTGSNINMEFFISSTIRENLTKENFDSGYFFGVEIYIDGNESPEFWGYLDSRTIEYDTDKQTYQFSVVDWITYYLNIWEFKFAGVDFNVLHLSIESLLDSWLTYNTLLSGVNVNVGDMKKEVFSKSWLPNKYTLTDYLKELQKHYGAYIYISADKTVNFVNRMGYNGDGSWKYLDPSTIINVIESGYEPKSYKAIAISYFYFGEDPDLNSISGGGFGDADVLILVDGQGWIIPMPYENGVSIDDFDRALLSTFPKHRFNYLDLRQRMPTRGSADPYIMLTYNPICDDTIANRFGAYKNILFDTLLLKVEVDGYNYSLLDLVSQDPYPNPFGEDAVVYQVIGVQKFLQSERAILTARQLV